MRLTDLSVRSLKLPAASRTKQKTFFDHQLKGFGVRVSIGGSKTFVYMHGKQRQLRTLGRYPEMTLAQARIEAKKIQGEVAGLGDAAGHSIGLLPFSTVRDLFIKDSATRTKASTLSEYDRLLNKHFTYNKPVGAVTRQDIMDVVAQLRAKPSAAQHAFVAVRTLMNWAVLHGHVAASPVPPLKFKNQSRERVLTDNELAKVWKRAGAVGYPYGVLVQLLILTGQRRGEVAGLRRSWINDNTIVLPAGFCKNKREHTIPLGPLAKSIVDQISGDGDLLFPARGKDDRPFAGWSKAKAQFDESLEVEPFTLHDLRRTFASNLAALGTPIQVTEKILNHVSGTLSGVAGVYNRYSYASEMRTAVESYEHHLLKIAGLAKVAEA